MSHRDHEQRAAATVRAIACGLITISDTRTLAEDTSGAVIAELLTNAGHHVASRTIVRDEPAQIVAALDAAIAAGSQVVITSGGTGIARRDSTFEALDALLEKRLPGFGEIFRMLSYQEIGAAAMLSRATAGTARGALVFALPGSANAVRLALDQLIIPQLPHLVWETIRQ
jgi:molybdenum cofactor biosynthesis protein B